MGGKWNESTLLYLDSAAVKFSPLMGGCLLVRLKTECSVAAAGGFGFAGLSARSMGATLNGESRSERLRREHSQHNMGLEMVEESTVGVKMVSKQQRR